MRHSEIFFTFHDVSINTISPLFAISTYSSLHSTMFLLIRHLLPENQSTIPSLHSTMFLLILCSCISYSEYYKSLHSTMFLLIRKAGTARRRGLSFTFHDVSINTLFQTVGISCTWSFTFHDVSINTQQQFASCAWSAFTFHDVSINTRTVQFVKDVRDKSLHSTMFLLIQIINEYDIHSIQLYIPRCFY